MLYCTIFTRTIYLKNPIYSNPLKQKLITRQQAYRIIHDAAVAVGIEGKIGTNSMRKTFGYHAYKRGVAISLLQKHFHHATPSETRKYLGITKDEIIQTEIDVNLWASNAPKSVTKHMREEIQWILGRVSYRESEGNLRLLQIIKKNCDYCSWWWTKRNVLLWRFESWRKYFEHNIKRFEARNLAAILGGMIYKPQTLGNNRNRPLMDWWLNGLKLSLTHQLFVKISGNLKLETNIT